MKLADAQVDRARRGEELAENRIEDLLSQIGLSDEVLLGTENVSPADRKKLSGIINRLRGKKHAFTTCMADLREHQPGWSEDRRKRTCAVLKALAKPGSTNASDASGSVCVLLDEATARLVDMIDVKALAKINEEAS